MTSWRDGTHCTLCLAPLGPPGHITPPRWAWSKLNSSWHLMAGPTQPALTSWPELLCPARESCRRPEATGTVGPCSLKTEAFYQHPSLLGPKDNFLPRTVDGAGVLLLPTWRHILTHPDELVVPQTIFFLMMFSSQNL